MLVPGRKAVHDDRHRHRSFALIRASFKGVYEPVRLRKALGTWALALLVDGL
jgi:hypothetical protein